MLLKQRGRDESPRMPRIQYVQLCDDLLGTNAVGVSKWTTQKGGEANPEHRPDVAVSGRPQDPLLQTACGFVDHRQHAPALNLLRIHHHPASPWGKQRIDSGIHPLLLALLVVQIETQPPLPARPPRFHDTPERLARCNSRTDRKSV